LSATDAFKSEIFRPLTSIAVPGAIAAGPFVLITQYYVPSVGVFWKAHESVFVGIVVVCVLAVGLLMENVGALIEIRLDAILLKRNAKHHEEWREYLSLRIKDEIIGQRYLRTVVTRMKFELAMAPSISCLFLGLFWIQRLYSTWTTRSFAVLTAFFVGLELYFLYEAWLSAKNLTSVRRVIIAATKVTGSQLPTAV
jgi:hypothetical protein